ncbi:MAG: ABC transporter permease [Gammaproteobacteria bacterium]|nr:ABC transporter permease [Gammaproteobacteria bacterium]
MFYRLSARALSYAFPFFTVGAALILSSRAASAGDWSLGANYLEINNDRLEAGRRLRPDDVHNGRPVVLVGQTPVKGLFPGVRNPVGRSLRIAGREYRVIGVLRYKT